MTGALRGAIFLDRDGTIIDDAHYLADASLVRLIPGAGEAIARINDARVPAIVITNQSGIARGTITGAQFVAVTFEIDRLLSNFRASIEATYHCPHVTTESGDFTCDCRKPLLGMYKEAARDHGIDLARSAYIGDRWRDVEPALKLGGLGILVPSVESSPEDVERARSDARLAQSLEQAVTESLAWMQTR